MTRDEKYRKTQKRNRVYRTRRALRLIRRGQPKTVEEARALGMGTLVQVGQGAFRTGYRIYGTNLLIKFPLMYNYGGLKGEEIWHDKDGKNHTRMEVKKIRALLEFPIMRSHLPPVYYFNGRDGVMVTKYYTKSKWVLSATNNLVTDMVKEYCDVTLGDLSTDNLRTEPVGNLIFIDLGY
jgi:hypothetical protein